jgi:hypothetical protein
MPAQRFLRIVIQLISLMTAFSTAPPEVKPPVLQLLCFLCFNYTSGGKASCAANYPSSDTNEVYHVTVAGGHGTVFPFGSLLWQSAERLFVYQFVFPPYPRPPPPTFRSLMMMSTRHLAASGEQRSSTARSSAC